MFTEMIAEDTSSQTEV